MLSNTENYKQALSTLSDEDRARVEAIAEIVELSSTPSPEAASSYAPAGVTCTLTSAETANFNGNIHYTEGGQISFTATRFTHRSGFPIAMAGGIPIAAVLKPERLAGKTGKLVATGWGPTGVALLTVDGVLVVLPALALAGAGFWGWRIEAEVQFSAVKP